MTLMLLIEVCMTVEQTCIIVVTDAQQQALCAEQCRHALIDGRRYDAHRGAGRVDGRRYDAHRGAGMHSRSREYTRRAVLAGLTRRGEDAQSSAGGLYEGRL